MKKIKMLSVACAATLCLTSCYTHNHTVGTGASGSNSVEKKQWFALWGLVPINTVNSKDMANGASNYNVKTEMSFIDGLISMITGIITISPRTVTVTK